MSLCKNETFLLHLYTSTVFCMTIAAGMWFMVYTHRETRMEGALRRCMEINQTFDKLPVTIIMVDHNSPKSFAATLKSYEKWDLLGQVRESILFAQQIDQYDKGSMTLAAAVPFTKVIGSFHNKYIHGAILDAVEASTSEYILLLEKDFQLITRPWNYIVRALALLQDPVENIKVVRMKSRTRPGVPESARWIYQYREHEILNRSEVQFDLACQLVYWKNDSYIQENVDRRDMWACGSDPHFWCATTNACHWTNQAPLFKRSWFMKHMRPAIQQMKLDPNSEYQRHHKLEISMRHEFDTCKWKSMKWTVALGDGIFSHRDLEKYPFDPRYEDARH